MNAVKEPSGSDHASEASTAHHARRFGLVAAAAVAALGLTSCAAGQYAATAVVKPAIAGTSGAVGSMELQNVSIQAPNVSGRDSGTKYYTAGDNAPMALTVTNVGHAADTLTAVTSPAFTSWTIVGTGSSASASAGAGAASGSPTPVQNIAPNERVGLGLSNLGVGSGTSPQTLVLTGLTASAGNLYPGASVDVTFTFSSAGSITLHVPVDLSSTPTSGSVSPLPTTPGA